MKISFRHLVVGMVMLASAAASAMLEPKHLAVGKMEEPDLAGMIPENFGPWHEIPLNAATQVTATVKDDSTAIYDQTLMRNYLGPNGERVMIAVAYGVRQNDELKVHRPDVCYAAAGFQILASNMAEIRADGRSIPVTRILTRNGPRVEPVTYWIRVGKEIMRGGMHERIAVIKAGLMGNIPDGLLFRVSTIVESESESGQAFGIQQAFMKSLLENVGEKSRAFLLGKSGA